MSHDAPYVMQVQDNLFVDEADIFTSDAKVLVNPVNCVGVMGGGLARKFKAKLPDEYFERYKEDCDKRKIYPGHCTTWGSGDGKIYVNFPTKMHYADPSQYEWIASGMVHLAHLAWCLGVGTTVALPALGCGLGNLEWEKVCHIIRMGSQLAPTVTWTVYLQ